jgi:hypothetical protein
VTLLALLLALHLGTVTPAAPGVFERVAELRAQWGQTVPVPPGTCLVATNYPDQVGRFVLVLTPGGFEACYVVDCAEGRDAIERKTYNHILEVDHQTWERWGTTRVGVALP